MLGKAGKGKSRSKEPIAREERSRVEEEGPPATGALR